VGAGDFKSFFNKVGGGSRMWHKRGGGGGGVVVLLALPAFLHL